MRSIRILVLTVAALAVAPHAARAQFADPAGELTKGPRIGPESIHRYKVGVIVDAVYGPCSTLSFTFPVPTEWPEQVVRIVDEDYSPSVRGIKYRSLDPGLNQMLVIVPSLPRGQTGKAVVTFEITRRHLLKPEDPAVFRIPKKLNRQLRLYLGKSVYIDPHDSRVRSFVRKITTGKSTAWDQVEAIFDHVRENVQHRTTKVRKGTVAAVRDGYAGNHDLTAVFVLLCRAHRVPARTVWVAGHCYAEFYLEDDEGHGHWIPCQVAGVREFGESTTFRTILQKGDNFKVPEKDEKLPYVYEHVKGLTTRDGPRPRVTFVREGLPE